MLSNLTTRFVGRLKTHDPNAWFELWETFGPVLRAHIGRWGNGWIGPETVQDITQETLAALSECIERHDPSRGARFSTWLLTIAKHTMTDELDRRNALKRGGGKRTTTLEESWSGPADGPSPDQEYEAAIFRSKVEAAVRKVERETEFMDFQIFRLRVLDAQSGKEVAASLGLSEPTVSRRLAKVRDKVRMRLEETVGTFSFTPEESQEASRKGLDSNPKKVADALFDESLSEVMRRQETFRRRAQEDSL
ncbi:MAG: hypothetical protein CMJ96_05390 [Planctomycetes bacterium]|jgi:RNA polymerase sigma factor (sigma-70 family)|nr:hypothetical protein [Planctomycetota bacterium]MDP7245952.1 sigma-70 family RNA polymerase sigma factor [Planctomycetota bacterium]|tara:strand:+ start:82938 stop:83687 length:750 start_codon:yes stop_codon:yes gene_type:complete